MRNVRRIPALHRPVFVTQVCKDRQPALLGIEPLLLAILSELRRSRGWRIHAHVFGADHLHLVVSGEPEIGELMRSFKLRAERRAGLGCFWQERFFDHVIRDDVDLRTHLDYLHYNPVKHGWSATPEAYRWTSYRQYLRRGFYLPGWGHARPAGHLDLDVE